MKNMDYKSALLLLTFCQQCIIVQLKVVAPEYQKAYRLLKDLTSSYNRMIRPNYYGKSAGVGIELYILGIPSVDDEKMELSLDMYFRQYWDDLWLNVVNKIKI